MGIFDSLKSYGGKWMPKAVRKFTQDEIAMVDKAQVVIVFQISWVHCLQMHLMMELQWNELLLMTSNFLN